jgi:hypothetical protein
VSDAEPVPPAPKKPPGWVWRSLVIVFGLVWVAFAGALVRAGGVIGVALGLVTLVAGLAMIAIASGIVEWWVGRRLPPADTPPDMEG